MTPEEPASVTLVRALVGESHQQLRGETSTALAELGGRIDVLAEAQRGSTEQQRLASEVSSREHAAVQRAIEQLSTSVGTVVARLEVVERGEQADDAAASAVAKWKRRCMTAVVTLATLAVAVAGVLVGALA